MYLQVYVFAITVVSSPKIDRLQGNLTCANSKLCTVHYTLYLFVYKQPFARDINELPYYLSSINISRV